MSDVNQDQSSVEPVESQQTLDDVYKEYNVEGVSRQFQAATAPQARPPEQPQSIPDPITEPDRYRSYQAEMVNSQRNVQETLNQYGQVVSSLYQQEVVRNLEADINRAVDVVKSKIDGDIDRDMIEVALDLEARRDPRFRQLFEERQQKPQAWNKALEAFSRKAGDKFAMRADPQLAENQRAIRASQKTQATTRSTSQNDEWANLSPSEFEQKWSQLAEG
jgi:hypothetical protein